MYIFAFVRSAINKSRFYSTAEADAALWQKKKPDSNTSFPLVKTEKLPQYTSPSPLSM